MKIILDTDIGSDIDDSFALAYLLNNENVELECITTVSGEANKRASLIKEYLKLCNKEYINVICGADRPLIGETLQPVCQQASVLKEYESYQMDINHFKKIIETINDHPGEITLIAIGPLTNVAILLMLDSKVGMNLQQLILMGGRLDRSKEKDYLVDWNIMCDPLAAKVVFESNISKIVIMPCDTTYKLNHSAEYLNSNVDGKFGDLIKLMSKVWFEKFDGFSYHDPLCCVYSQKESLFTVVKGKIKLDYFDNDSHSYTSFTPDCSGNHYVVTDYVQDKFLDELYSQINKLK